MLFLPIRVCLRTESIVVQLTPLPVVATCIAFWGLIPVGKFYAVLLFEVLHPVACHQLSAWQRKLKQLFKSARGNWKAYCQGWLIPVSFLVKGTC